MPTIYYPPELREQWPNPLAAEWLARYPQVFDRDDWRQTQTQPEKHFVEWFTAVHIFHTTGECSLIEKAQSGERSHPRKFDIVQRLLSEERRARLDEISYKLGVNWPDLLVYRPGSRRIWFAEVKGPRDRLRPAQTKSHDLITRKCRIPVKVYSLVPVRHAA